MSTALHCSRHWSFAVALLFSVAVGCGPAIDDGPTSVSGGKAEGPHAAMANATSAAGIGTSPGPDGVQLLSSGSGWKRLALSGTFVDADSGAKRVASGDEVLVLSGEQGILAAPLPQQTRDELLADLGLAVQQGTLPDPDHGLYFVHRATADKIASDPSGSYRSSCNDYDKDIKRSTNFNEYIQFTDSIANGSFNGSMRFDASIFGAVSGTVRLRVKRGSLLGVCVPYAVGFVHVKIGGMASAGGRAAIDGAFAKQWSWKKQIAKPTLTRFNLWIGPIPVLLGFNVPVDVGLNADAKSQLDIDAEVYGSGMFSYTCTSSGCSGSKSYSHSFQNNSTPSLALSGRAKVRPWLQAAVRAYLYRDDLVRGQVGVRPYLEGDLWGYAGNTCGDGDHDGKNEFVRALTLDADVGVDITAAAKIIGILDDSWSWSVGRWHVGFWKIGAATAASPMFWYSNTQKRFYGRMRPCWPYEDAVTYVIDWKDGSNNQFTAAPHSTFSKSHTWTSGIRHTAELTAKSDAHGRAINTKATATTGYSFPDEAVSGPQEATP